MKLQPGAQGVGFAPGAFAFSAPVGLTLLSGSTRVRELFAAYGDVSRAVAPEPP
jgi:hypothetical protein